MDARSDAGYTCRTMSARSVAEARLRLKNQLTLPEAMAEHLEAEPDDVLEFEADPDRPGAVVVRRLPRTFAGSMRGIYGTTEEMIEYLREEHESWKE